MSKACGKMHPVESEAAAHADSCAHCRGLRRNGGGAGGDTGAVGIADDEAWLYPKIEPIICNHRACAR